MCSSDVRKLDHGWWSRPEVKSNADALKRPAVQCIAGALLHVEHWSAETAGRVVLSAEPADTPWVYADVLRVDASLCTGFAEGWVLKHELFSECILLCGQSWLH